MFPKLNKEPDARVVSALDVMRSLPISVIIAPTDTVSAIFQYTSEQDGKIAALNFASYKHPGGMFIKGSSAQEESLCHASFLYNVLKEFEDSYYKENRKNLNRSLYTNKALYSPNIKFFNKTSKSLISVFLEILSSTDATYFSSSNLPVA